MAGAGGPPGEATPAAHSRQWKVAAHARAHVHSRDVLDPEGGSSSERFQMRAWARMTPCGSPWALPATGLRRERKEWGWTSSSEEPTSGFEEACGHRGGEHGFKRWTLLPGHHRPELEAHSAPGITAAGAQAGSARKPGWAPTRQTRIRPGYSRHDSW